MQNKSLLITPQLLKIYRSAPDYIDFMEKYYKDGTYLFKIFEDEISDLPLEFIHWIYYNLPLTDEDKENYLAYVNIIDTMSFYSSYYVENSFMIADSLFCKNSKYVLDSSHIDNSSLVFLSEDVYNSSQIVESHLITSSNYIYQSDNIENSEGILYSKIVCDSTNIGYSTSIYNSHFLVQCLNTYDSFLSRNLEGCSNKLLCFDIKNNNIPMILNEEVPERRFETLIKIFKDKLKDKIYFVNKIDEEKINFQSSSWMDLPQKTTSELLLFYKLLEENSEVFMVIKKNIPDYNKDLLYQLTLSPKAYI